MLNIKKYILYFLLAFLFIIMVIYSSLCMSAAKEGLSLWINIVFPSLFPFFIASSLLISCGAASAFGRIISPLMRFLFKSSGESGYIMATSMLSGYPMGPRLCSQMHSKGLIVTLQVEHFLSFVNTSGPSFIIGAVASGMLNNPSLGAYIAFSHFLGTILTGMLFSIRKEKALKSDYKNDDFNIPPLGTMLSEAVNSAMQTQLIIGGFIVLFSIIIKLLLNSNILQYIACVFSYFGICKDTDILEAVFAGLFEITNSCAMLAKTSVSMNTVLPLISAVISFSGFSILMQSFSLVQNTGVKFKSLLIPKIVHAILTFLLCKVTMLIFPISAVASNINFNSSLSFADVFINSLSYSVMYFSVILIIVIANKILQHSKKPA